MAILRSMLSYRTAGESHGPTLLALVEGLPSGLAVDTAFIDAELARRQGGYGRGGRQRGDSPEGERPKAEKGEKPKTAG